MTFWSLTFYAILVLFVLVLVFLVLPGVLARGKHRGAKPKPLQGKNQKR